MIGISVDTQARNKAYAKELGLNFPILSDTQKTVSRAYGVLIPFIKLANRTTFVIDQSGAIQSIQKGDEALDPNNAQQACSLLEHKK